MLHRDYVLRLIEQFTKRLGAILARKRAGDIEGAEASLAETARQLIGMDVEALLAFPPVQLLQMFRTGGILDLGKCLVAADILKEYADIAGLLDKKTEAVRAGWLSLRLYLEAFDDSDPDHIPDRRAYEARTEALLQAFEDYEMPPDMGLRVVRFFLLRGRYADAEDLLFVLVEEDHPQAVASGIELFRRLRSQTDDALERGGLTRPEVEDALRLLEAKRPER